MSHQNEEGKKMTLSKTRNRVLDTGQRGEEVPAKSCPDAC